MELVITSMEIIKPSLSVCSSEPFKLSLLDQLNPRFYTPLIFFYPLKDSSTSEPISILNKLKYSLSQTLNLFYPLSGRVQNNLFISNYDDGVPFAIAKVKGRLLDFLRDRELESLNQLLPCEPYCLITDPSLPQLAVQASIFDCGGLALGMSFLHKIGDGATIDCFLQSWAANTSGCFEKVIQPDLYNGLSVLPPLEQPPRLSFETVLFKKARCSVRRFVFDEKAIESLRTKSKSEAVENPSRVQATLAFIWMSAMMASKRVCNSEQSSIMMQAKNVRRVTEPQCSNYSIGNIYFTAATKVVETDEMKLSNLVVLMKDSLDPVNTDMLKPACIAGTLNGVLQIANQNIEIFMCTSWNTFNFDDIDFGWGKPRWCGVLGKTSETHPLIPNMMVLKRVGGKKNAIEAWMWLREEVAVALDHDFDFLSFASPNPALI